jgi:hypothetical protein
MPHLHHINQALRAHALFHRDVDYMVKDGEVVIVDEFTGRLMPGRRVIRIPSGRPMPMAMSIMIPRPSSMTLPRWRRAA